MQRTENWSADKIRAEMKHGGNKTFILMTPWGAKDLHIGNAGRLEGHYRVQETAFEVIVTDNGRRVR